MTPWAKRSSTKKYLDTDPGPGLRNDPILQCDPDRFPVASCHATPIESLTPWPRVAISSVNTNGVRSGPTGDLFPPM